MEAGNDAQEFVSCLIDRNEATKRFEGHKESLRTQMADQTNFLRECTGMIVDADGVSEENKTRAVDSLDNVKRESLRFTDDIYTSFSGVWYLQARMALAEASATSLDILTLYESLITPRRKTVLNPAKLITDHTQDQNWTGAQGIRYYLNRLQNYPATIQEMDNLAAAMMLEMDNIAQCEARMRQLQEAAGADGIQLDPAAAARMETERVAMLLRVY